MNEPRHLESVQSLFIQHQAAVRATVLGLLPNLHAADDVVQETFLTVCRKAEDFQAGTNFAAWVCTIARYKAREALRKGVFRFEPLSEETAEAVMAVEPDGVSAAERLRMFEECICTLAPKARLVMELRYRGEHLPDEIARRMSWSVGAVKVAISRARAFLRDCVARKLAEELS
jgi:RNA polymerase sigma-70 factor (ECF subfamily)